MTNIESKRSTKPSPIEVWIRQDNMAVTCTVVREDESIYEIGVEALSLRGAQREITGRLVEDGYEPVGRWRDEADGETVRRFKLVATEGDS